MEALSDGRRRNQSARKTEKIHRFQIGLNVIVQIAIIIVLAAMVNYLGFEHYRRWDLSRDKNTRSPTRRSTSSTAFKGKVRMTVFFGRE